MKKHPGLERVDNFKSNISKYARDSRKGYCDNKWYTNKSLRKLIDELKSNQFEERPYRDTNLNSVEESREVHL